MKYRGSEMAEVSQIVFVLRHIETGEYVCLNQQGRQYLVAFTSGDAAAQFRAELGVVEFVDWYPTRLGDAPFDRFWLDGEMIGRGALRDRRSPSANS